MTDHWAGAPREPRAWQRTAMPVILAALREGRRPLIEAKTGTGKAFLLGRLAFLAAQRCEGTTDAIVVCAPTRNLVRQLSAEIATQCDTGVYYSDEKTPNHRVVVACNPSLGALTDELAVTGRACRLFISDEAHLSQVDSVLSAMPKLNPRFVCGFTATPHRTEKSESLSLFSDVAFRYGLADALRDGVLVPWRVVNYNGSGDDDVDTLCSAFARTARGPGIVSARTIVDADEYAARLRADGVAAESIHSQLPTPEYDRRIAALLAGEYHCLVHVALLVTGVDIPALRWLAMRRPSASALRFVQEFGRILRTHPGKEEAVLFDPYDLMGAIGLVHAANVGEAAALLDAAMEREAEPRPEGAAELPAMPRAVAVDQISAWARATILAMYAAGLADSPLSSKGWREGWATPKAIATLRKFSRCTRFLNEPSRAAMKVVIEHAEDLRAGAVSDAIGVLLAARKAADKCPEHARIYYRLPRALELPELSPDVVESLRMVA